MKVKIILSALWIVLGIAGLFINYLAAAGFLILGTGNVISIPKLFRSAEEADKELPPSRKLASKIMIIAGNVMLIIYIISELYADVISFV